MRTDEDRKRLIEAIVGDDPERRERYLMDAPFHAGVYFVAEVVEVMMTGIENTRESLKIKKMVETEVRKNIEPWPDGMDMIRQAREAAGLFGGAMPLSPKEAWEDTLVRIREMYESVKHP